MGHRWVAEVSGTSSQGLNGPSIILGQPQRAFRNVKTWISQLLEHIKMPEINVPVHLHVFHRLGQNSLLRVHGGLRLSRFFAGCSRLHALEADLSSAGSPLEALAVHHRHGGGTDDAAVAADGSGETR